MPKFLELISRSPLGKRLQAEARAEDLADRRRLRAEIDDVDSGEASRLPGLRHTVEQAEARQRDAWAAYRTATRELGQARAAVTSCSSRAATERNSRLRQLHDNSPDADRIDDFVSELDALLTETRRVQAHTSTGGGLLDQRTRRFVDNKTYSTLPPLQARLRAIFAATAAARVLRTAACEDVEAEVARIRDGIPSIDYVEVDATGKPVPQRPTKKRKAVAT